MAKLADAADLKSADPNRSWGFKSPSGHQGIHRFITGPADLSANPTTITVTAGQTGTTVISVTPAFGFNQQVSFACSGLPASSACSFSRSTLTPTGNTAVTTTLTVSTDVSTAMLTQPDLRRGTGATRGPATFLAVVLLGLGGLVRTRRRWGSFFLAALLVVGLGLTMAGCGGSSSSGGGGGGGGGSTTPAGTSTVTVTATAGSLSQTTTFTLTVQ
jgi:hypothetical protein